MPRDPSRLNLLGVCLLLLLATACAPRGVLGYSSEPVAGSSVSRVLVATTRQAGPPLVGFSAARSATMTYARYDISLPPTHRPGAIEWAGRKVPDPQAHFATRAATTLPGQDAFIAELNRRLGALAPGARDVTVFVPGYNNTFAESLYRLAQIEHDLGFAGVSVLFSWPSAGTGHGYVYDRDSALFSRDGLQQLLQALAASRAERIVIVSHSMGSFLTVETLRQMYLAGRPALAAKLKGVMLMSPDIDIDLFGAQLAGIHPLPQPFVVFTSRHDRALRLSALISGETDRLGNLSDLSQLAVPGVIVIDLSDYADGGDWLHHATFATAPAVLPLLQSLPELDRKLSGGQTGLPLLGRVAPKPALVRTFHPA